MHKSSSIVRRAQFGLLCSVVMCALALTGCGCRLDQEPVSRQFALQWDDLLTVEV